MQRWGFRITSGRSVFGFSEMGADYPFLFTWTEQSGARPIEIVGGHGAVFEERGGKQWLDFASLSYHANLGHGETRIVEAIKRQADQLSLTTPNAVFSGKVELANRLLGMAPPGFGKVFFTNGGAEAIENAIKIARIVTNRHKIVGRYRSYHGATMGAISISGDWRRIPVEPGLPGVVRVLDCYCDRCPFGQAVTRCSRECATQIEQVLELEAGVAAVVLETVPGANGVLVPPPEYLPMVRSGCDQAGTLLIADEVLTGFGRTGKTFAFEHYEVVPDMIALAKGLTAGYGTLGALLVSDKIANYFCDQVLPCGLTNYAHPLGCAAALAALDIYDSENINSRSVTLGKVMMDELSEMQSRYRSRVPFVRAIGLLAGLELDLTPSQWHALRGACVAEGLYVHIYPRRSTVVIAPPLVISEEQIVDGLDRLDRAIEVACA